MECKKLAELIEPFINWQFKDMPPELCQHVSYAFCQNAFYPIPHWDELEPHQRLSLALKYDTQQALKHASQPEFNKAWELDNEIEDIQSEIDRCKSIVPVSHADDVLGQTRISELEAKKAEIERQYLALKGEVPESMPVVQAPDQTEAVVPVTNKLDDETKNDEWKVFAQLKAKEYIKQQREADLYPSQENISDHIAREFRATGIVGADKKPLSGATIKRHALKGISSAVGKRLSTTRIQGK